MTDELIDIFDENNTFQNKSIILSEAHKRGLWHRAAHIWVYNSKGEILLQLRSKEKHLFPNLWEIAASGHIGAGEEPIIAALRELEEEIGIKAKKTDLELLKIEKVDITFKNIINREFCYVYLIKYEGNSNSLTLQKEEVSAVKFFLLEELKKEIKENPNLYVPHKNYWFEIIEKIKTKLS